VSALLVDTHVVLWSLADVARLSAPVREQLEDPRVQPFVSAASLWEAAVKMALGKLQAPPDLPQQLVDRGFTILPVQPGHAWAVRVLPPHHRDPFDRLLIAQAQAEGLPIATADPRFAAYAITVVW